MVKKRPRPDQKQLEHRFKYLHGLKNYCQKTPKTQGCDQQTYDNLNILIRAFTDNKANNQV